MKKNKIRPATIIRLVLISFVTLIIVVSAAVSFKQYSNKKSDSETTSVDPNKVRSNLNDNTATSEPKNFKSHKNIKTKKYFNSKNLNLNEIPSTQAVKDMVKDLLSIDSASDVKKFKKSYDMSTSFAKELPSSSYSHTTFKFSHLYGGTPKNITVSLDYDDLTTSKLNYLVTLTLGSYQYQFIFTYNGTQIKSAEYLG